MVDTFADDLWMSAFQANLIPVFISFRQMQQSIVQKNNISESIWTLFTRVTSKYPIPAWAVIYTYDILWIHNVILSDPTPKYYIPSISWTKRGRYLPISSQLLLRQSPPIGSTTSYPGENMGWKNDLYVFYCLLHQNLPCVCILKELECWVSHVPLASGFGNFWFLTPSCW